MAWLGLDAVGFIPDAAGSDWYVRAETSDEGFFDVFGPMRIRRESDRLSRLQLTPLPRHLNIIGSLYGGYLLSVIDLAIFIGPAAQGRNGAIGGSTIDLTTHFFAPFSADKPVEILIETMQETGRMIFVRGTAEQEAIAGLTFSAAIRKADRGSSG